MRLNWLAQFAGGVCVLFCTCAMYAQTPLAATIGTLLNEPKIEGAHWGISVTQMDGTPIYALNDDKLFQPASNTKLFTTAVALALFDPAQKFIPYMQISGVTHPLPQGGVEFQGNLVLYGDGNAYISDRAFPYQPTGAATSPVSTQSGSPFSSMQPFVDALLKEGVRSVTGDIVGDDSTLFGSTKHFPYEPYGAGWNVDDLPWGYGAPVSATTANDNELKLTITPSKVVGDPASVTLTPAVPAYYVLQTSLTTGAAKTQTLINVDRAVGSKTARVYGSIGAGANPDVEYISIDDPAEYAAAALKSLLEQNGIAVAGIARAKHQPDTEYRSLREEIGEPLPHLSPKLPEFHLLTEGTKSCDSDTGDCFLFTYAALAAPTVAEDVTITNKVSQNLHAELLLRELGILGGTAGSFAQGARVVRQFAINAGVKPDDFYFVDGSGLSNYDLATPRAFTQMLRYAATQPWGADYKSSLPIGGVDGTLEKRFTKAPLKGNVFAKTGTLSEDRALSGYVVCASGNTVVFSILVGQHLPGSTADRDVMDKIVAAIAAAN